MQLEEIIKQQTFQNQANKAGINLLLTASWFGTAIGQVLRPFGMSWQQYNIMRILQGQQGRPASLKLVSERMIDKMSNTSRLVDKLVAKDLVERSSCPEDRRRVEIKISTKGKKVLAEASKAMDAFIAATLGGLEPSELSKLNTHLDQVRESFSHSSKSNSI